MNLSRAGTLLWYQRIKLNPTELPYLKLDKLLTITLIVKNEAGLLPACLASIQGLGRCIVVDTGSQDASPQIACEYGAELYSFEWCNDFSAARNFALAQVRTPWVMIIDADERLTETSRERLPELLSQLDPSLPQAYCFLARSGAQHEWTRALFPRLKGLVFYGRVHETLSYRGDYVEHLLCEGFELERIEMPFERVQDKTQVYLPLIQEELQRAKPGSAQERHFLNHLAQALDILGRPQESYQQRKRLCELYLEHHDKSSPLWPAFLNDFLPQLLYYEASARERERLLAQISAVFPEHHAIQLAYIQVLCRSQKLTQARQRLAVLPDTHMPPSLRGQYLRLCRALRLSAAD